MIPIGTTLTLNFTTANPTTGAPQNADSLPTVDVYEDVDDTPILSPTPVNRAAGEYRVQVVTTADNGFEVGKSYNVVVTATVATVAGKKVVATFIVAEVVTQPISGSAAINTRATDGTVHTGNEGVTTFADTRQSDGVLHVIDHAGNAIDVEYEFQVGSSATPTSLTVTANLTGGAGSSLAIKAYNWITGLWGQVGSIPRTGGSSLSEYSAPLFAAHVGTGVDAGRVLVRFADGVGSKTRLDIDLLYVSYAVRAPTSAEIATGLLATNNNGITVGQSLAGGAFNFEMDDRATVMTIKYDDGTTAFVRNLTRRQFDAIVKMAK